MSIGPDHDRWADAAGAYVLGALEPDEAHGYESHLSLCGACQEEVDDLRVAADALPASAPQLTPPPELKDRIMAIVEREAQLLRAAGPEADRPPQPAPAAARRRYPWADWSLRRVAVGFATALLVGVVAGSLIAGGDDAPQTRTVLAQAAPAGADVRLEVRPEHSTLVAQNLPAPPEDRIYQVWIKRPGEAPEPTDALFTTRDDGSASVDVPGSLKGV